MTERQGKPCRSGTFTAAMFKTHCLVTKQSADDVCAVRTASQSLRGLLYCYEEMMSMGWNGLERNKLDYLLSDLLPVELSELFSFGSFYSFLLEKEQQKKLSTIIREIRVSKAENRCVMFEKGWATKPLKYSIMKDGNSFREMSVIQPFSALNVFLFMECYQKEILDYFRNNHRFSLRYHRKNTDLFYKTRRGSGIEYFQPQSEKMGKSSIQQTGSYFQIYPFESINAFADSLIWRMCNFRFNNFAKMDYKACFDSIYTHSYSWIIERNVIDARKAKVSNLYITIDRILENINGRSSNGVVVGPEFSRMIAEILLESIDNYVFTQLSNEGLIWHKDYEIFRYVDDIFIFTNEVKTTELIIDLYSKNAERYRLRLNDLKMRKEETPCLPKEWLEKTRALSDVLADIFFRGRKSEYDKLEADKRFLVTTKNIPVDRIKDDISIIIKNYSEDRRSVVSFLLSTLLNNVSKKKNGYTLFGNNREGKAFLIIDLALYIYAFFPSFDQTRKIISIITYINAELDLKNNKNNKRRFRDIFRRYSFILKHGNLFDLCDWFPFLLEYEIHLGVQIENELIEKAKKYDDPILWANIILYSTYDDSLLAYASQMLSGIILNHMRDIGENEVMLHTEFWYVLIFHNCPYIDISTLHSMESIISSIRKNVLLEKANGKRYPSSEITLMMCDYLERNQRMERNLSVASSTGMAVVILLENRSHLEHSSVPYLSRIGKDVTDYMQVLIKYD